MKALQAAAFAAVVVTLGLAAWCCGPKLSTPELVPTCPGEKFEVCEHDELGAHDCYCP